MSDGWKAARAATASNFVAVERARRVLDTLRGDGWSCKRIAQVTGLSPTTLTKIIHARVETVAEATYEALLSLADPPGERLPLRQRFDPEPLICAISVLGIGGHNAHIGRGADWSTDQWLDQAIKRWRDDGGLSWHQADTWANRLGLHPADALLWGDDWWSVPADAPGVLEPV